MLVRKNTSNPYDASGAPRAEPVCRAHGAKVGKLWRAFTFKRVRYLAFQRGAGVHIVDEQGNNYGSWESIENFKSGKYDSAAIGKIRELSFQCA